MVQRTWFPEALVGSGIVLRRHVPANLAAFRRWYADPEIARLARYQEAPMRPEEIDRFFTARVVGTEALAMAIHDASTGRLIGTCAFSQLDAENGSALYHITIGEKDAWGRGYGTEATRLMVDHAFGTLGLHRIALFVFEFNERAIRSYRRCGFVIEGRSRESIWRDGRWWDELAMSVLESDWRRQRDATPTRAGTRGGASSLIGATAAVAEPDGERHGEVEVDVAPADGGGATTRLRRPTLRSWR
jgi:RimJ/RimL family protein N-acetyltransferase